MLAYTLFPSDLGPCGILWGTAGVIRVQLPAAETFQTVSRLLTGCRATRARGSAPTALITKLQRHLAGTPQDFLDAVIDLSAASAFNRSVYRTVRRVPAGAVISYGQLAEQAGNPRAARAVGTALARNPCPILIPCHRVVRSDGGLGEFSAPGGVQTKRWLLARERP